MSKRARAGGSATTWVIWGLAVAAFLGMVWQFGWLPIGLEKPEAGSLVRREAPPDEQAHLGTATASVPFDGFADETEHDPFEDADPELLAAQSEPPVEVGDTGSLSPPPPDAPPAPNEPLFPEFAPSGQAADAAPAVEATASAAPAEPLQLPLPESASNGEDETPIEEPPAIPPARNEPIARSADDLSQDGPVRPASVVRTNPGPVPAEVRNKLAAIDALLKDGQDLVAHRELSTAYWVHPQWRPFLRERIEKTAQMIYFAPQPHYMDPYVVQPGDQLRLIAKRYNVPWQYLVRLNRIEPTQIRPGQKLKVIKGPFSAHIDLSDMELTVHAWGYFVRRYPVGIGKDGTTPIGKFTVKLKEVNPVYYGPDGVIDRDDPENPLGERWIDIGDGYGIHGTIAPESIGKAESRGCIRMYNSDVEELFDLLSVGSEVVIQR